MSVLQEAPRSARLNACLAWSGAVAAFAVPFVGFTAFFLYQFYVKGSFLLDAGYLAFLMSEGGLRLASPITLGGGSFFTSHIAPLFVVTGLIKRGLPGSDAQFFSIVIALGHALPGLGVYWVLRSGFYLRGPIAVAVAAFAAIAFSFNGLALAIARYPHFEILIVGGVILFAVALMQRRLIAAAVIFALTLTVREDAGFHLFGILFVVTAVNRWYGVPWRAQRAEMRSEERRVGKECRL